MRVALAPCITLLLLLPAVPVHAGDWCVWYEGESEKMQLVRVLTERGLSPRRASRWLGDLSQPDTEDWLREVLSMCFLPYRQRGHVRWAGPNALRTFEDRRNNPELDVLRDGCQVILDDGDAWYGLWCMRALATHGVRRVGSHDVFALQERFEKLSPYELAILGDPRGVEASMQAFRDAEQRCDRHRSVGEDTTCFEILSPRRLRFEMRRYRNDRTEALNALWHLASPDSRDFLREVAEGDPDAEIQQRARAALARVDERHPPTEESEPVEAQGERGADDEGEAQESELIVMDPIESPHASAERSSGCGACTVGAVSQSSLAWWLWWIVPAVLWRLRVRRPDRSGAVAPQLTSAFPPRRRLSTRSHCPR